MHLSDGEIRAYLDGEASRLSGEIIEKHLQSCARCRDRASRLERQAHAIDTRLDSLTHLKQTPTPANIALTKFTENYLTKENDSMSQKLFSRSYHPAWIAAGILLILVSALLFPPVQAVANSFLGLFRVEKVTVVQIDAGNLPERLGASDTLQALFSENTTIEQVGEYRQVANLEEAGQLAGITVRLPAALKGEPRLEVQPGGKMTFQVDLALVNELLKEIGYEDIRLPSELDGAEITAEIPLAVIASYGNCRSVEEPGADPDAIAYTPVGCTNLIQVASPTIHAPPGLDLAQIGSALLQVAGMSPQDAEALSQQIDWTTTLVLPIPRYEAKIEQVNVDGVEGTFIQQAHSPRSPFYMLVWVKNGIIYALAGSGEKGKALSIADTLQ